MVSVFDGFVIEHTRGVLAASTGVNGMLTESVHEASPHPIMAIVVSGSYSLEGLLGYVCPSNAGREGLPQFLVDLFGLVHNHETVFLVAELDRIVQVTKDELGAVDHLGMIGTFPIVPLERFDEPTGLIQDPCHIEERLLDRVDRLLVRLAAKDDLGPRILDRVLKRGSADTPGLAGGEAGYHANLELGGGSQLVLDRRRGLTQQITDSEPGLAYAAGVHLDSLKAGRFLRAIKGCEPRARRYRTSTSPRRSRRPPRETTLEGQGPGRPRRLARPGWGYWNLGGDRGCWLRRSSGLARRLWCLRWGLREGLSYGRALRREARRYLLEGARRGHLLNVHNGRAARWSVYQVLGHRRQEGLGC